METLVVFTFVGLVAQFIDGSLGMAYGATSATLLLGAGITPPVVSASVHLAEIGTTLASGASHWRFGNIDWRTVRRIGVPGAFGAFTGAVLLSSVSTEAAKPWMAGLLFGLGLYVLTRFAFGSDPRPRGRPYVRGRFLAPLGLVAGFIDATGGGGWGPVATPTLLVTGKMEPRKVIGSIDTSEFLVATAASLGFLAGLRGGGVEPTIVGALLVGGLLAAPLAAWFVRLVAPRVLGASVGGLILVTNARTLFGVFQIEGATRLWAYVALCSAWAVALAVAIIVQRRNGQAILTSDEDNLELAVEPA
ncbi:MAG: sulfite exporter TauE/SafE family protein [Nitriliruptorales bacterium]